MNTFGAEVDHKTPPFLSISLSSDFVRHFLVKLETKKVFKVFQEAQVSSPRDVSEELRFSRCFSGWVLKHRTSENSPVFLA